MDSSLAYEAMLRGWMNEEDEKVLLAVQETHNKPIPNVLGTLSSKIGQEIFSLFAKDRKPKLTYKDYDGSAFEALVADNVERSVRALQEGENPVLVSPVADSVMKLVRRAVVREFGLAFIESQQRREEWREGSQQEVHGKWWLQSKLTFPFDVVPRLLLSVARNVETYRHSGRFPVQAALGEDVL